MTSMKYICPQCGGKKVLHAKICRVCLPRKPFEYYINRTETCWLWTGGDNGVGYGKFYNGTCQVYAHRFSWEQAYGHIPSGLQVLHRCDIPACVRPEHLFLGTAKDNMKDCSIKGRCGGAVVSPIRHTVLHRGPGHWAAKVKSLENIRTIRKRRLNGEKLLSIAKDFGISNTLVCKIARGKAWTEVT